MSGFEVTYTCSKPNCVGWPPIKQMFGTPALVSGFETYDPCHGGSERLWINGVWIKGTAEDVTGWKYVCIGTGRGHEPYGGMGDSTIDEGISLKGRLIGFKAIIGQDQTGLFENIRELAVITDN